MTIKKATLAPNKIVNFYDNPEIMTFNNAIYHCGLAHFDLIGGVFTREGYLIPQAAFFHRNRLFSKGSHNGLIPKVPNIILLSSEPSL